MIDRRDGFGIGAAEGGTWGHGIHAVGFREPGGTWSGASGDPLGTWKPQIGSRLLEQGPAVSALLEPDWVACRPSLVPPGSLSPLSSCAEVQAIGIHA